MSVFFSKETVASNLTYMLLRVENSTFQKNSHHAVEADPSDTLSCFVFEECINNVAIISV